MTPLDYFEKRCILVIGDVLLDQYWQGTTDRISPEAPVQVINIENQMERPGGAGNVALNIASLQSDVFLLGVVGADPESDVLEKLLRDANVVAQLEHISTLSTIRKLRVVSLHQQLLRLDFEKTLYHHADHALWDNYLKLLPHCDAIIISDYQKGTIDDVTPFIKAAKSAHIPILIDPKNKEYSNYRGADVITPNRKEFESIMGVCKNNAEFAEKGLKLLHQFEFNTVIIKRGAEGVTLIQKNGTCIHLPSDAHEVYDVTGAGDTFIALLALGIANQADILSAAKMANMAAGIVVTKLGPVSVTPDELRRKMKCNNTIYLSEKEALEAVLKAQAKKEKVIMTNGCFDILHAGHIQFLEEAKSLGDRLIVAVNGDASVARLKGKSRPINSLETRIKQLAALRCVDWIVSFDEDTPETFIRLLNPDILAKGGDYKISEIAGAEYLLQKGREVKILKYLPEYSTSDLIKRLK